jgi:S1-C subfamily serine protease
MTTSSSNQFSPLVTLSNDLAAAIAQAGEAVVSVNARQRFSSSGVHWQSGIVVTADHSIRREEDITVTLANGQTTPATLIGRDSGTDLAILRLQTADFPTAELGNAADLKVGHLVLAIGRSTEGGVSASMGVISALSGTWRTWHGGQVDQFIRPDLTMYRGFAGGALINTQGQVVGINTAGPRHMALTIPATTINRVVEQLQQRGRITRGYLGVGMQPVQLPQNLRQSLNWSGDRGVIIVSVEPNSPADQGGILIGDVLVALNDRTIADLNDVHTMLDPDRVGKPLTAQVIRGGSLITLTITVGERPGGNGR